MVTVEGDENYHPTMVSFKKIPQDRWLSRILEYLFSDTVTFHIWQVDLSGYWSSPPDPLLRAEALSPTATKTFNTDDCQPTPSLEIIPSQTELPLPKGHSPGLVDEGKSWSIKV